MIVENLTICIELILKKNLKELPQGVQGWLWRWAALEQIAWQDQVLLQHPQSSQVPGITF